MKQVLSLKQKQKLVMTPQLQQSINILQLSVSELSELIEREFMENPALDMEPSEDIIVSDDNFDKTVELFDYLNKDDEKPEPRAADEFKVKEFAQNLTTLTEVLLEQAQFAFTDKQDLEIANYIIGLLDSNGYLRTPLPSIAELLQVSEEHVATILTKLQECEPDGVCARNLQECLRIQAQKQGEYVGLTAMIIDQYLPAIGDGKIKDIALLEKATPEDIQASVDFIRTLNPKPGASYGTENPSYIIPDVTVRNINGRLEILINDSPVPRLHINPLCKKQELLDRETRSYIEKHVNSAMWLIKSIEQRRQTMLKVITEIVEKQEKVFLYGFNYLQPLTMKQVADNIGMHESTISRCVSNKYIDMPFGVVSLKKFFPVSVNKHSGEIVTDKVKQAIEKIIAAEDKRKPWSDQQICNQLMDRNMTISRRTVVKYREQLGIPASSKRKRY